MMLITEDTAGQIIAARKTLGLSVRGLAHDADHVAHGLFASRQVPDHPPQAAIERRAFHLSSHQVLENASDHLFVAPLEPTEGH